MASEGSKMEENQTEGEVKDPTSSGDCDTSNVKSSEDLEGECANSSEVSGADQAQANAEDGQSLSEESACLQKETVDIKIVYNKQKHDISFPLDDTVTNLKEYLEKKTGVPVAMQKIMFKGRMKDDQTLREHKVVKGSKIMLVGSTVNDVMSVTAPDPKVLKAEEKEAAANKEALCKQKPHKTVLEKHGKPDDAMPGIKGAKHPLPPQPLSGMYNKSGGKVRLTFKMETDSLWIGTKERTEKLPMASIKAVVSEPLAGHEEYHMMGIQLGPTEASRYWIYWVPTQYVDAIKDSILGKWQFF